MDPTFMVERMCLRLREATDWCEYLRIKLLKKGYEHEDFIFIIDKVISSLHEECSHYKTLLELYLESNDDYFYFEIEKESPVYLKVQEARELMRYYNNNLEEHSLLAQMKSILSRTTWIHQDFVDEQEDQEIFHID